MKPVLTNTVANVNNGNVHNRITVSLFIIYLIALYWILLLKLGVRFSYSTSRRVNLIPFNHSHFLSSEHVLNIIVFIPLGIYTGVLFRQWSFIKQLAFFCGISALVEALQYILRLGAFDITDIINNTLGGVVGLILFKLLARIFRDDTRAQKLTNIVAAIGTALMVLLLAMLKMNILPIKYR